MNAHDHQSLSMLIRERVAEIAAFEPEEIREQALMNPCTQFGTCPRNCITPDHVDLWILG